MINTSDLPVSKCKFGWLIHGKIEDQPEKYSNVLIAHSKIDEVKSVNRRMKLDTEIDEIINLYFYLDGSSITNYVSTDPAEVHAGKILEEKVVT